MFQQNNKIRILLLGAGRRVEAARLLKEAATQENLELELYSYDSDSNKPIASEATIIPSIDFNDEKVSFHIEKIIEDYKIDICLGFHDRILGVLPALSERVFCPGMSKELVEIFTSKALTKEFLISNEILTPSITNQTPAIAKPIHGSASKGIIFFDQQKILDQFLMSGASANFVVEQIISGPEYTIDCYKAVNSEAFFSVTRKRIEVSGGEVVRAEMVRIPELQDLAKRFSHLDGISGAFNIQVIQDLSTSRFHVIEINPRFAGGVTTSVNSGMPWFQNLLRDFLKIELLENKIRIGTIVTRALVDFVHDPN